MGAAALWAGMTARCSKLCPDREIFLRSGGQVKFIQISRRAQLAAVGLLSAALVGGIGFGLSVAASSAEIEQERAALAARDKSISSSASQVARYRKSVDQLAQELQERQDFMDDLYRTHFGQDGTAPAGDVEIGRASCRERECKYG